MRKDYRKSQPNQIPCNLTLDRLQYLYEKYNRREYVHPDPLEFLYSYPDPGDREVVALIASSLAYGSVKQILKTVSAVLEFMSEPRSYLLSKKEAEIRRECKGFKYRFTTDSDLANLLIAIQRVLREYGSLFEAFSSGYDPKDETVCAALTRFVHELTKSFPDDRKYLLPNPETGSACKRLNLFLRWMVRNDEVDPGGWTGIAPSKLLVPVDIHMHRISLRFGLTERKQANFKAACEITNVFKRFSPDDPVRFDFALTRFGIRDDMNICDI